MAVKAVFEQTFEEHSFPYMLSKTNNEMYLDIIYCHWHNSIELIYVTEGVLSLQVDMNFYDIKAGEAAIINSGEVHYANSANEGFCNAYAIVFDPHILSFLEHDICQIKYIDPLLSSEVKFPTHIAGKHHWEKQIISDIERLISLDGRNYTGYELLTKSLLYSIVATVANADAFIKSNQKTLGNPKVDRLKKVMTYIHNQFHEKLYISDLAAEVNMSEDNFYKYFKNATGKTPTEFINNFRMQMAERLLMAGNASVSEVGFAVGFDNVSYFIKTFKKYRGCTPREYLKRFQNGMSI